VRQVSGQHPAQLVLRDDQQPIDDLAAHGADDRFAEGVRFGRLRRAGKIPDAVRL
jgi:hypothetical protein